MPLIFRRYIERINGNRFNPSSEEQIEYQKKFLAREQITDHSSMATWLDKNGISEPQLSQRLFRALQIDQFKQATFGPRVETRFLEKKSMLDRVMYSLIRVRDRPKAFELHLRLEEEEDTFADLAFMYSEGIEKQINGLFGPMELGMMNPVLAERLRISKEGQLWPPFEEENWWVIIRLERHPPPSSIRICVTA